MLFALIFLKFTCLCPKTGQPDFATLHLEYIADKRCIELKALKNYIWSFRNEGAFHEAVTNQILDDLVTALDPRFIRLKAIFNVRGGIYTAVESEHRQKKLVAKRCSEFMKPIRQTIHFDKKLIDKDAQKVVKTLSKAGHEAYLVGGCIRDLLLGHKPKDFDIATSATPEQVHKTFKRSRLIGRRFRLVHIMFSSRKYIEVATFRSGKVKTAGNGVIVRDNLYGTLKEDVFRRDFSVNALYYDIQTLKSLIMLMVLRHSIILKLG